jgi:hypothetical protein
VFNIAEILFANLTTDSEGEYIHRIMLERKPSQATEVLLKANRPISSAEVPDIQNGDDEVKAVTQMSRAAKVLSPALSASNSANETNTLTTTVDELAGVEIVFIQYRNDQSAAEKLRKLLISKGVNAPGVEKVDGIRQHDIRYAGPQVKRAAMKLAGFVETEMNIELKQEIDLSAPGYSVPDGQFEVWLNL